MPAVAAYSVFSRHKTEMELEKEREGGAGGGEDELGSA